jgi:short-subunit dehydrogenase
MEGWMVLWHVLAVIGAIKIAYDFLPFLYWSLFSCINMDQFLYGYALVTGSTDGIGKAIAKELLRRGFKVILISRNLEKLQKVKDEFIGLYPTGTVEIIQADFEHSHRNPIEFYTKLVEKLARFPISVLVNNIGVVSVKLLSNDTDENIEGMIGMNIYPSTILTHCLVPSFLNNHKETGLKSLVINMSSVMEESIFPGNAVYSATKRYNAFFSEGLRYEYSGKIYFATVKPGVVVTSAVIRNNTQSVPFSTDPDTYAKGLISGLRTGVNHGYWKHKIFGFFLNLPPYLLTIMLVRLALPTAVKKGLVS